VQCASDGWTPLASFAQMALMPHGYPLLYIRDSQDETTGRKSLKKMVSPAGFEPATY